MTLSLKYSFIVAIVATASLAQMPPQLGGKTGAIDPFPSHHNVFITGKVLTDDGTVSPTNVQIEKVCGDEANPQTYADSRGEFQFQLTANPDPDMVADTVQSSGLASDMSVADWNNCELRATAVGFTSGKVSLAGKIAGASVINVGTLFIHHVARSSDDSGSTTTVADLAVPEKAKKDFVKGENSVQKSDWKAAQQNFRKALDRYPRFSAAWAELARTQQQLGDNDAARESFQKALEVNPRLLAAYMGLSGIALQNRRWKDLQDSTDRLLAIDSNAFPQIWLLNAVAKYNLGLVDPAETSILRGLRLDTQHRYPKMEHLFGVILGVKRQYAQAVDHLKAYLRLSPKAPDAAAVQVELYKFQQLAESSIAEK
jgi:tetratricopeptide (TPR) repeat protein